MSPSRRVWLAIFLHVAPIASAVLAADLTPAPRAAVPVQRPRAAAPT